MQITGKFEVTLQPTDSTKQFTAPAAFGRMTIDKVFSGALNARSVGEMLSVRLPDSGSAGYVAIEQVTGTLESLSGSFVLQHYGVMTDNSQHLTLEVIPGSGTDQLSGLTGVMDIRMDNGQHFYYFDFQLTET